MKRKILLKFISSLTLFCSIGAFGLIPAYGMETQTQDNEINPERAYVPNKQNKHYQMLKNSDGTKIKKIEAEILQEEHTLTMNFNNSEATNKYPLAELEEGWSYFVVLIDSANKGPIKSEYLNKKEDGSYSCSFDIPFYCDVVDLHVYKQQNTDPAYTIKEENFIGRTKVVTHQCADFMRGARQEITFTDKDGNLVYPTVKNFIKRLTPNYYSIETTKTYGILYYIGKIVLPEGQGKNLTKDDLTVQAVDFVPGATPAAEENWNGAVYPQGRFYNFYLPSDVTEFKFQIFKEQVTDNANDVLYEVNVNLNKL